MKKEKKKYSLVTKEVLNVIHSLVFFTLAILKLIDPQNPVGKLAITILVWVAIADMLFGTMFRIFVEFDMEDEAALEHYDRAKKKVLDFIWGFFAGAGIVAIFIGLLTDAPGIAAEFSINITVWHFLIVLELLQLAISLLFIYFEKREA